MMNRRPWPFWGGWSSRVCPHGGGWGWQTSLHALLHRLPHGHQAAPSGSGQLLRQARNPPTGTERGNGEPGMCGGFLLQSPFHHPAPTGGGQARTGGLLCDSSSFSSHVRLRKVLAPPPLLPLLVATGLDSEGGARSRSENTEGGVWHRTVLPEHAASSLRSHCQVTGPTHLHRTCSQVCFSRTPPVSLNFIAADTHLFLKPHCSNVWQWWAFLPAPVGLLARHPSSPWLSRAVHSGWMGGLAWPGCS